MISRVGLARDVMATPRLEDYDIVDSSIHSEKLNHTCERSDNNQAGCSKPGEEALYGHGSI